MLIMDNKPEGRILYNEKKITNCYTQISMIGTGADAVSTNLDDNNNDDTIFFFQLLKLVQLLIEYKTTNKNNCTRSN
jgi:hypothetical protein